MCSLHCIALHWLPLNSGHLETTFRDISPLLVAAQGNLWEYILFQPSMILMWNPLVHSSMWHHLFSLWDAEGHLFWHLPSSFISLTWRKDQKYIDWSMNCWLRQELYVTMHQYRCAQPSALNKLSMQLRETSLLYQYVILNLWSVGRIGFRGRLLRHGMGWYWMLSGSWWHTATCRRDSTLR